MTKDDRELVDVLKEELDFIEKGGYGRSVRTPRLAKSIFEDSLSCLNYGYPYRAHPCNECLLHDFVPPEHRLETVPCHHIPLDKEGDTIEDLALEGDEPRVQKLVRDWLRTQLDEKQQERETLTAER
jgi:hypothetical protein